MWIIIPDVNYLFLECRMRYSWQ